MRDSIRLGRAFGIPVGLHWSLLLVGGLLTFSLASGYAAGGASTAVAVFVAGAAAVLFLGSILAHELAHAVVARRNGTPVEGITLWLLGGVARLGAEARSPGALLRIAAAGPALSLVLAAGFGTVAVLGDPLLPGVVGSALAWLAVVNAVVTVFNLIPAAPLDGGRILAAVLWARHGDRDRASATAGAAGRVFGGLLVGLGIVGVFTGYGTVWTALLGWFVLNAAGAERAHAGLRHRLRGVTVGEAMTPEPQLARGWLTVDAFVTEDLPHLRGPVVPVQRFDGSLAGVVTLDRLRAVPPSQRGALRVLDVTVPLSQLRTADPGERLVDVLTRPQPGGLPHVMVFDGERLAGVVSPDDMERASQLVQLSRAGL